jgi:hypothetical protein
VSDDVRAKRGANVLSRTKRKAERIWDASVTDAAELPESSAEGTTETDPEEVTIDEPVEELTGTNIAEDDQ